MRKQSAVLLMAFVLGTFACAQDQKPLSSPLSNDHLAAVRDTYRLDYTITETEDGKKVNSRTYSVMCEDRENETRGVLKVGSRVPVNSGTPMPGGSGSTQITYLDVGMNIDSRLKTTANGELTLQSDVEMSSIADSPVPGQAGAPVIRQLRVTANNVVTVGKPVVISAADDVASHRQFQIQVLASKVK